MMHRGVMYGSSVVYSSVVNRSMVYRSCMMHIWSRLMIGGSMMHRGSVHYRSWAVAVGRLNMVNRLGIDGFRMIDGGHVIGRLSIVSWGGSVGVGSRISSIGARNRCSHSNKFKGHCRR